MIGLKISRHFLDQSKMTRSRTFSRVSRQLHAFALSFDWFTGLSVCFVIGQSIYFGFGFTTLNWKLLYLDIDREKHCRSALNTLSDTKTLDLAPPPPAKQDNEHPRVRPLRMGVPSLYHPPCWMIRLKMS